MTRNHVYVPDYQLALWLQGIFQGSLVEKLPMDFVPVRQKLGRPKKYASDAERQKAYRARQTSANAEAASAAALLCILDATSAHNNLLLPLPNCRYEIIL